MAAFARCSADEDEFREARDLVEERRKDVLADQEGGSNQDSNPAQRQEEDADGELVQVGLDREEQDGEEVLQDEDAQRHAPGQGVEFAFFVEDLDDDDRTAHGGGSPEVERVPAAGTELESEQAEDGGSQSKATEDLHE